MALPLCGKSPAEKDHNGIIAYDSQSRKE